MSYHQTINHDLDIVDDIAVERNLLVQVAHDAINADAGETLLANVFQDLDVVALLAVNHRREHLNPAVGGACVCI